MLTAMVGAICFLGQYYVIPEQMQRLNSDLPFFLLINALALILYFLAFSFTIFLHRWVAYQQRLNELENISIQTDLNHLKDQLQPEFFSRILNKVRTLLGEDGEKASLLIFKLSRLLRYQLYESERQQVLLGDDIDFMTDYMKLEKLCNPEFNFEVNILNEVRYIQVPPLLFMPVIEYVIQTTVCGENGKGENIRIDFQMEENQLRFICTYCLRKKESLQVAPAFDKLRQRLDLLYPGGYQLKSGYNDGIMKDTWNVYEWGKNLVNDRFRLISNLLLLFIILFLGFQNVYGDFTREGFLYAYPVSILVSAPFPV